MKKNYFLVLSILFIYTVYGQITLTGPNNTPSLGDNIVFNTYDSFNEGALGANITWDFSPLVSTGNLPGKFVLPSTLTDDVNYPLANMAIDVGSEVYYYVDDNEYSLVGLMC